jgi:hypothetical protein
VLKGLFTDKALWSNSTGKPALRHVLEARAAWL